MYRTWQIHRREVGFGNLRWLTRAAGRLAGPPALGLGSPANADTQAIALAQSVGARVSAVCHGEEQNRMILGAQALPIQLLHSLDASIRAGAKPRGPWPRWAAHLEGSAAKGIVLRVTGLPGKRSPKGGKLMSHPPLLIAEGLDSEHPAERDPWPEGGEFAYSRCPAIHQ